MNVPAQFKLAMLKLAINKHYLPHFPKSKTAEAKCCKLYGAVLRNGGYFKFGRDARPARPCLEGGTSAGRLGEATLPVLRFFVKTLVIGYGNQSRRDDGAGLVVIDQLREMALPGVELLAAHQLELDLCETVSRFDFVIFVDAALAEVTPSVMLTVVEPTLEMHAVSHYMTPSDVLAMSGVLYGSTPCGLMFHIPAHDMDFGDKLSSQTKTAVRKVVRKIRSLVTNPRLMKTALQRKKT